MKPVFSIVFASYNQLDYTRPFIESVRRNSTLPYEIVAIDNGSDQQTISWLRSQRIDRLIRFESNLGTTKAWNEGIKQARGEYIVVINNDGLVAPRWLEGLKEIFDTSPGDLGTLSPSVNGVTYELNINPGEAEQFYAMSAQMQSSKNLWPDALMGCAMAIPRKTLDLVGSFDERFFCYYNDLDYCLSLTAKSLKAYTTSRSTFYHFGGKSENAVASAEKRNDKQRFLGKWSQVKAFLDQYFSTLSQPEVF